MTKPCFHSPKLPRWLMLFSSLGPVNALSLFVLLNVAALVNPAAARADLIPLDSASLNNATDVEPVNLRRVPVADPQPKAAWQTLKLVSAPSTPSPGVEAIYHQDRTSTAVDGSNVLLTIKSNDRSGRSTWSSNANPAQPAHHCTYNYGTPKSVEGQALFCAHEDLATDTVSRRSPQPSTVIATLPAEQSALSVNQKFAAALPLPEPTPPLQGDERSPTAPAVLAQTPAPGVQSAEPLSPASSETTAATAPAEPLRSSQLILGTPSIHLQGAFLQQADEASARLRLTTLYPVTSHLLLGGTVDLTTGRGFSDSPETGLDLNELYVVGSLPSLPELRLVAGLMDLTSYFDRNSFAKDSTTHFFNSAFQTNPALAAAGISSRIGLLLNWSAADNLELKLATFSSSRDLSQLDLNGFAGEVEYRIGTGIIRATYAESRDAGADTGFDEIFQLPRDNGTFGLNSGDREAAFGLNAEWYVPALRMGLFGRLGRYQNRSLDEGATTYSFGVNFLDLFLPDDRLGLAYGQQLSNADLRRDSDSKRPDVLELFYDIRVLPRLRAGVTLQQRNEFSETVAGFRLRTDLDISPRR